MDVCPVSGRFRKRSFVGLNEAHNDNDVSGSIITNPVDENIPDWLIEGVHVRLESGERGVIKAASFGMATVELEQDSSVSYTTSFHDISLAIPDLRDNIIITRGRHVALEGELVSRDLDMTVSVQLFDNTTVSCRFENIAKRQRVIESEVDVWEECRMIEAEVEVCEESHMVESVIDVEEEIWEDCRMIELEVEDEFVAQFENEGGIPPPDDPSWARLEETVARLAKKEKENHAPQGALKAITFEQCLLMNDKLTSVLATTQAPPAPIQARPQNHQLHHSLSEHIPLDGAQLQRKAVSFEEAPAMNEGGSSAVEDEAFTRRRVSFEKETAMNAGNQFENEGGIPPPDDPSWARLMPLDDAISKATFYLNKTMDKTRRCGHGPITPEEENAYNKIVQGALMFLKRFYFHITNETGCCGFCDEHGLIRRREIGTCSESKEPGTYLLFYTDPFVVGGLEAKIGCSLVTVKKRVSDQVQALGLSPSQFKAYILGLTTPELKKWLEGKGDLIACIKANIQLSPAFSYHKSKEESAYTESATRLVEFALGCLTKADPRLVLEKSFNRGPKWVREKFSLESLKPDPALVLFLGKISCLIRLRTWETFISAVLRYISDQQTQSAVDEMVRRKEGGFLTKNLDDRAISQDTMASNDVTYKSLDAVDTSASFEEMMRAFNDKLIPVIQLGDKQKVKRVFDKVIKDFSGDGFKTYARPESDLYQAYSEKALLGLFADDSLDTSKTVLIEVDRVMMEQLSTAFMKKHLPETNRFGNFYEVANIGENKRIIVSVLPSFFTMASLADDSIQSGKGRIERMVTYLENLAFHHDTGLLSKKDYISENAIWKAAAIQMDGLDGNGLNDNINTSQNRSNYAIAYQNALPENYTINPFKEGVRGLGNMLTPGVGMKDEVTIAIVVLLGWDYFKRFIRLYLGREIIDMQSFLQEMKVAGAGVGRPSPLLGTTLGRPSPLLGRPNKALLGRPSPKLGRPSPLLGKTTAAYFMVRVAVEDGDGNKVLTTVQAHRGKTSLRLSYKYLNCVTVALIETGGEDGYTEEHGVFNIVSSNHFNLPRGFDDYAVYAKHLKCNPNLIHLYYNARTQCNKLRNIDMRRLIKAGD